LPLLDPLAGVIVSGMILKAGIQTGYESVLELVDAAVDPSLLEPIRETILKVDGVKVECQLLPEIHFVSQFCIFLALQCHDYRSF